MSGDILQLIEHDTQLKKVATTGGGEWAGGCPLPGCICDKDGFRVQPNRAGGGRWFCRGCGEGRWHDGIDYLMRREGLTFSQAKEKWEGVTPHRSAPTQPEITGLNRGTWTDTAQEFYLDCAEILHGPTGVKAANWLYNRGLSLQTIIEWTLGYNPADRYEPAKKWGFAEGEKDMFIPRGIVIPNFDGKGLHAVKIRRPTGSPKYLMVRGSNVWPFGGFTCKGSSFGYLFESELDALLAHSTQYKAAYLALPAGQHLRPEHTYIFEGLDEVILMPDNDKAGAAHAAKLAELPGFYQAPNLPKGKDLTEFAQAGGDVFEWLYSCAEILDNGQK